ncbi:GNAT family N-acetyltransferase [Persicobacter psychrovividus]|uniref:N-acetyltransferase n=1 Tax=Persicobacter psychrovividus TaxID=387638 RepID=A0ABM7VAX8_9BACT|nr:N-acetyltransferase [Persicobacter psychrovividus]
MSTSPHYRVHEEPIRPAQYNNTAKFETKRITVRPLNLQDLPAFSKLLSQNQVTQYTIGKPLNKQESSALLQQIIDNYNKPYNDHWVWAAVDIKNQQFLGTCSIVKNAKEEEVISMRLDPEVWGKGYGFELAKGLTRYAVKTLRFKTVKAYIDQQDAAGAMILMCCGFKQEASESNSRNRTNHIYTFRKC